MDKFIIHRGIAAPIVRANINTDAIIPSWEMKRVSKNGLGEGLFAGWRYTLPGGREKNPEFILNQADYLNTSIILSGDNFGCGSSREHAAWALKEYGIRVIIAPSFGSIFYNNCARNGILLITLSESKIDTLAKSIEKEPQSNLLTIDLPEQLVKTINGLHFNFEFDATHKSMLLNGLDTISLTQKLSDKISSFEQRDRQIRPWIYL